MEKQRPKIGIAVYILNPQNQVLLQKRKTTHAGTWAPPGGHLEMGESFLECIKREVKEEVDLEVADAELWAVTNNVFSPESHYVNLDHLAKAFSGQAKNMEPEKCEEIAWFDLANLPRPLMYSVENFLNSNPACLCRSGKKFLECHGKNFGKNA